MSRSALWRQEMNVQERDRIASEIFQTAVNEGKEKARMKGIIPLVGSSETFNMNPVLIQNIAKSPYFQKCYREIKDWNALVDEIYYEVKHVEPWTSEVQKIPSTAFSLLVRLLTLRCTEKQISLMLCHPDSPYIRCIGFLYLRYAVEPSSLWKWFEPYLYDEEPVQVTPSLNTTIGQYVRDLLTEMNYVGTLLPRLPIAIERDLKCKLLLAEKVEQRAREHMRPRLPGAGAPAVEYFEEGVRVRAMYGDEENPVTWYDAIIDRVIRRDEETGEKLSRPKYVVTFPEYGNTELVTLGELDLPGSNLGTASVYEADLSRGKHYGSEGRNKQDWRFDGLRTEAAISDGVKRVANSRSDFYHKTSTSSNPGFRAGEDVLMEEVLRRERDKIAAKGRQYSRRPPPTLKSSISTKQERNDRTIPTEKRSRSPDQSEENTKQALFIDSKAIATSVPPKREKTSADIAAIAEKKRRLLEKYG